MTALLDTPVPTLAPALRLQRVLRADAAVTGTVGVLALALPRSTWGDAPGWIATAAGVVCLVAAVDVALATRWSDRRLRLAGVVTGELALLVAVAAAVCAVLPGVELLGRELLLVTALASAGFGVTELRLARALR